MLHLKLLVRFNFFFLNTVPYGPPAEFKEVLVDEKKIELYWNPPGEGKGHVKVIQYRLQ